MNRNKIKIKIKESSGLGNNRKPYFIDLANENKIIQLKSDINYTHIHFEDGSIIRSALTLLRFYELLKPYKDYVRINRSTIINAKFITNIEDEIIIVQKKEIIISRRRYKEVVKQLLELV